MQALAILIIGVLVSAATDAADTVNIGEMRLCRATVKSASIGSDQYTGQSVAIISLKDEEKASFASLTKRNIGKRLPVTLNGNVIAEPWIAETVMEGQFTVNGSERKFLERLVKAASNDC